MFAVEVREHIMIAHSFNGKMFGPAQALHGATFIIDACFFSKTLDENGVVIDIGKAHQVLKETIEPLNYRNLDEIPDFNGKNTTTEFLTKYIFDCLAKVAKNNNLGRLGTEIHAIRVTLSESHVARAWFESTLMDE